MGATAVSDDAEHLVLCVRLGRQLVALGMRSHAEKLRWYMRKRSPPKGEPWTKEQVIELAKALRIPPHENAYPVRERMASCGCATPSTFTRMVWPGGSLHACGKCHQAWVELV